MNFHISKVRSDGFALTHALVASLPCEAAITTNYDTLFEAACAAGQPNDQPIILPYDSTKGGRFLLKLHGCATHPDDIVLTRSDYLHYSKTREALGSILQSVLIRHHVLFIGFSLSDENYIRLQDAVQQVSATAGSGTALFLFSNAFEADLNETLNVHAMVPPLKPGEKEGPHAPAAARKLEVFLDYLSMMSTTTTNFLLDPAFESLISPEEAELARMLRTMLRETPQPVQRTLAFARLREFIEVTFGASKEIHSAAIEAPLLLKPTMTMGKLLRRLREAYVLVEDQVRLRGKDGLTLKERHSNDFPNSNRPVSEFFAENDILECSGESYLVATKSHIGFSYKMSRRQYVEFRFKIHYREPDAPGAKDRRKKQQLDRSVCSFFVAGCCRNGYHCPLKHVGLSLSSLSSETTSHDNGSIAPPPPPAWLEEIRQGHMNLIREELESKSEAESEPQLQIQMQALLDHPDAERLEKETQESLTRGHEAHAQESIDAVGGVKAHQAVHITDVDASL